MNPKNLNPGEHIVLATRTHVKVLALPALVLLVSVGLAGYFSSLANDHGKVWLIIIWVIAAGVVLVFSVWPFLVWLTAMYMITDRRLTTHKGVFNRTGHDIPLSRISDVSYEKSIVDRVFGCGTLKVSDASDKGAVLLLDVPKVAQVQLTLSDQLFHGSKGDVGD